MYVYTNLEVNQDTESRRPEKKKSQYLRQQATNSTAASPSRQADDVELSAPHHTTKPSKLPEHCAPRGQCIPMWSAARGEVRTRLKPGGGGAGDGSPRIGAELLPERCCPTTKACTPSPRQVGFRPAALRGASGRTRNPTADAGKEGRPRPRLDWQDQRDLQLKFLSPCLLAAFPVTDGGTDLVAVMEGVRPDSHLVWAAATAPRQTTPSEHVHPTHHTQKPSSQNNSRGSHL